MITAASSLVDVAFAVCTALDRAGSTAVMTGGSAATYYAPDAYQSSDIDFVITVHGERGDEQMAALGYRRRGDFYEHAVSPFPIEFPPGPLMIGEDLVTTWATVHRGGEVLYVLSPTDSCRDRLAAYLFWNDFSALEQAISVWTTHRDEIDLARIRDWCRREGHEQKFGLFANRLGRAAR